MVSLVFEDEVLTYEFLAILIKGKVDCAEGASPNLLLDDVLVDAMLSSTVIFACDVLGVSVERFLRDAVRAVDTPPN